MNRTLVRQGLSAVVLVVSLWASNRGTSDASFRHAAVFVTGPTASSQPAAPTDQPYRVAKGELVERYFAEPGESEESVREQAEALDAKHRMERATVVPLPPPPEGESDVPPVVDVDAAPVPVSPDAPAASETPRRPMRPLFMGLP